MHTWIKSFSYRAYLLDPIIFKNSIHLRMDILHTLAPIFVNFLPSLLIGESHIEAVYNSQKARKNKLPHIFPKKTLFVYFSPFFFLKNFKSPPVFLKNLKNKKKGKIKKKGFFRKKWGKIFFPRFLTVIDS